MAFSFCVWKGSCFPSWGFFCCLCGCCYWVIFLDVLEDGDARLLLPLPSPECSGRCSFIMLSTAWRSHGVDSCGESKAWSCSLALAGRLLPGSNVQRSFDLDRSYGERRRSPVLFPAHGVVFFVICVISRVLFVKRSCISPTWNINPFSFAKKKCPRSEGRLGWLWRPIFCGCGHPAYMFGWVDTVAKFFVWLDGRGWMETKLIN
jgi:hypothetical protein